LQKNRISNHVVVMVVVECEFRIRCLKNTLKLFTNMCGLQSKEDRLLNQMHEIGVFAAGTRKERERFEKVRVKRPNLSRTMQEMKNNT
jgi:hypothetical protein